MDILPTSHIERDIRARVREVLMQCLQSSGPSQEEVAEQLCMSSRTLQNVSDIACLPEFSSCSSLARAFRRWTGQSPSDLRGGAAAP